MFVVFCDTPLEKTDFFSPKKVLINESVFNTVWVLCLLSFLWNFVQFNPIQVLCMLL